MPPKTDKEKLERVENMIADLYKRLDKLQDDTQSNTNSIEKVSHSFYKHRNQIDAHEV